MSIWFLLERRIVKDEKPVRKPNRLKRAEHPTKG